MGNGETSQLLPPEDAPLARHDYRLVHPVRGACTVAEAYHSDENNESNTSNCNGLHSPEQS